MSGDSGSAAPGGSGRRRRSGRSGKGGKGRKWGVVAVVVIGALLAANLAKSIPGMFEEEPAPEGFLTPEILLAVGLWVPLAAIGVAAGLGIKWSRSGFSRGGSQAFRWALTAFGFALFSILVLLQTVYDPEMFPRERLVVVFVVLLALQVGLFTLMMRAQAEGGATRRHHRPRSGAAAAVPEAARDASHGPASTAGAAGKS